MIQYDENITETLLIKINDIIANNSIQEKFNVFDIIGISNKEVYMCRFLAELLNPNGCHKQGTLYLDLFYKKFLTEKYKNLDLEHVSILLEAHTDENDNSKRRMDIVIDEKDGAYIPIEVKIDADEQENQCQDYLEQARKKHKERKTEQESYVYFLTMNGKNACSINSENKKYIIPLSWGKDITSWLNECINKTTICQVKQIIKQYKEVFIKIGVIMDIQELLSKNPKYYETAQYLVKNFKFAEDAIWENFRKKIEEKIKKAKFHDQWKIVYELKEEGKSSYIGFAIDSEKKETVSFKIAKYSKDKNEHKQAILTLDEHTFDFSELADEETLNKKVELVEKLYIKEFEIRNAK